MQIAQCSTGLGRDLPTDNQMILPTMMPNSCAPTLGGSVCDCKSCTSFRKTRKRVIDVASFSSDSPSRTTCRWCGPPPAWPNHHWLHVTFACMTHSKEIMNTQCRVDIWHGSTVTYHHWPRRGDVQWLLCRLLCNGMFHDSYSRAGMCLIGMAESQ